MAFTTATAMRDPRDLYHSSQQRQILNPLSEARDPTRNLMVLTEGTPDILIFVKKMSKAEEPSWALGGKHLSQPETSLAREAVRIPARLKSHLE